MAEVIWISHRGYCEDGATENTRASFDASLALGFNHLETDLRLTRDGIIVLHHDDELQRTFGVPGRVSELSWAELTRLKTKDSQSLLRLDDLYARYSPYQWTFDIKPPEDEKTLAALSTWLDSNNARDWFEGHVRFLFWSERTEALAKRIFPNTKRLAREAQCYRAGLASLIGLPILGAIQKDETYSLPPRFVGLELFSARILQAYRSKGARLLAYLPPTEELAKKAYMLGFDEILTNGRKCF